MARRGGAAGVPAAWRSAALRRFGGRCGGSVGAAAVRWALPAPRRRGGSVGSTAAHTHPQSPSARRATAIAATAIAATARAARQARGATPNERRGSRSATSTTTPGRSTAARSAMEALRRPGRVTRPPRSEPPAGRGLTATAGDGVRAPARCRPARVDGLRRRDAGAKDEREPGDAGVRERGRAARADRRPAGRWPRPGWRTRAPFRGRPASDRSESGARSRWSGGSGCRSSWRGTCVRKLLARVGRNGRSHGRLQAPSRGFRSGSGRAAAQACNRSCRRPLWEAAAA